MIFNLTKNGHLFNETHRECTSCGEIFEKFGDSCICKKCNNIRNKKYNCIKRDKSIASIVSENNTIEVDNMIFNINKSGYLQNNTHRQCTNCKKIFLMTSKSMSICNLCNTNRIKSSSLKSRMHNRAQQRSKNQNIEFDIEIDDIIIPTTCPILNIPMVAHSGRSGGKKHSPSLDRINPELGYTKGNIMVISHLANQMKSHANPSELIKFSEWISKTYNSNQE